MNSADLIWVSVSTILVLLMIVPGVALFYGGLVRAKNVLSILTQVIGVLSLVLVLWFIYGYSLTFTENTAFFGNFSRAFFVGMFNIPNGTYELTGTIPELTFASFQASFAGITCALIIGGFAERLKFKAVLIFIAIWVTFAYIPVAHMIWGNGGFLVGEALDFAGGTVVHINAGIAALVVAYTVGPRIGYGKDAMQPHNLPMTYIGACLLWIGWFGFNAGSSLGANHALALAFFNTIIATAAGVLGWILCEAVLRGKASLLGGASGAVSGLVAVTPAAALVGPIGALIIGFITSIVCVWGVNHLKRLLKVDDTLDVFGIHGVGGIVGGILTGVFNAKPLGGPGLESLADIPYQLWLQVEGMLITAVISGVVAFIAIKIAALLCRGVRVDADDERQGLDITAHGEQAYQK